MRAKNKRKSERFNSLDSDVAEPSEVGGRGGELARRQVRVRV